MESTLRPHPTAAAVAARAAGLESFIERCAGVPAVTAIVLCGSAVAGIDDLESDVDLVVYVDDGPVGEAASEPFLLEPGCTFASSAGHPIDVTFRSTAWTEARMHELLDQCTPCLGYTTTLWASLLRSWPLYDRAGWFARLLGALDRPYPEALRTAIVAANFPALEDRPVSCFGQLRAALFRSDTVGAVHALSAFLALYFDVLYAFNRVPHPGEKRVVERAAALCAAVPPGMTEDVPGIVRAVGRLDLAALGLASTLAERLGGLLATDPLLAAAIASRTR